MPPQPLDRLALIGEALLDQARWCGRLGSPLYAGLLERAARDAEAGGPVMTLLRDHAAPGRGGALALRLMAAAHRLVLTGRAPALAAHYPSTGGVPRFPQAWEAFRDLLVSRAAELTRLLASPCQTNEVGRSAALIGGFLALAARFRLPLSLLEVGASAGLNLRWDHFFYSGGGARWGDPSSPVRLDGFWSAPPPLLSAPVQVADRRGCDPQPIDPGSEAGALALRASVWADQEPRLRLLEGALELARRVPAEVDAASADVWAERQLRTPRPGRAVVVYHSVMDEYLDAATRQRFRAALAAAGARASESAPLAWLQLEPLRSQRWHSLTLTTWPGGDERWLGECGGHGAEVSWTG